MTEILSIHEPVKDGGESVPDVDPALEHGIVRKLDFHILPWLFGMWFFCFLDRSNIGNAKIEGLDEDLHLTGDEFNVALTLFFVPYILVDVPSNWLVKRLKPGNYLPALTVGWGLVSTFLGFVQSYGGLVAARVVLGIFEGGLAGGIVLYLSTFYPRRQMVLRIALFYCAAPLSGAFGGLLASGLSQIQCGGYNRWPWIFFIEGALTTVFGISSWFFLPHSPETASFLIAEEREAASQRMILDFHAHARHDYSRENRFNWHWVRIGILDPNTLLNALGYLAIIIPIYSFAFFLPTIINTLGYSPLISQLLTVPPNMAGFMTVLLLAALSDKVNIRGPLLIGGCLLAIIGYVMLLVGKEPTTRYGGTFFVAAGIYPCSPITLGWLANQITPHYARATAGGFQIAVANLAAFVATFAYLPQDAPEFRLGNFINIGALILAIITTGVNIAYIKWENGKRERGERDYRLRDHGIEWLGHLHPSYRYTI
ncbi:hypothetical protein N7474_007978 [Penicillium riverlandense]|uniref:uncharacterized protein n=1 Tax=Penicillium riverlandense TaxID=1903569 RepID=UPI0025486142|nr:uncharacterized protein N7474_007978 [Penicillium riverlandense]KAJ5811677.1 hypothetical protein N7474_007978 [Penicillium riverlandense]